MQRAAGAPTPHRSAAPEQAHQFTCAVGDKDTAVAVEQIAQYSWHLIIGSGSVAANRDGPHANPSR